MTIIKEVSEFGYNEINGFAGIEYFEDGSRPLVFIAEKDNETIYVLGGNNGVEVYIENEEDKKYGDGASFVNREDFNGKDAIVKEFNRVVKVIKDNAKNPFKGLIKNLFGYTYIL